MGENAAQPAIRDGRRRMSRRCSGTPLTVVPERYRPPWSRCRPARHPIRNGTYWSARQVSKSAIEHSGGLARGTALAPSAPERWVVETVCPSLTPGCA